MSKQSDLLNLTDAISVSGTNVGIGVSDPSELLEVGGATSNNYIQVSAANNSASGIKFRSDSSNTTGWDVGYEGNGNYLFFRNDVGGAVTERMRIASSGNVGIGTSSPDLVGSTTTLTIDNAAGNGQLSLKGAGTVYGRIFADNATGDLKMGNPTANDVMLYTANLERMRIDSAGRVTMPYQPAFKISYSSASGGDTGSDQDLTFKVQEQNIGGHYNSTTGKFTAPVSGTYMFVFNLLLTGMGGGDSFEMFIKKNGNSAQNSIRNAYSSGSTGLGGYIAGLVVCQVPLSVNDFVTFQYYRGGSTAIVYSSANWSNYSGHLIG